MTREEWLEKLVDQFRPMFGRDGINPIPDRLRISCGWPSIGGTRKKKRVLGECFTMTASAGGTNEIFVSPLLDDPIIVGATALHECIHASDNCASKHKGYFVATAKQLGLLKPWTATHPSDGLASDLRVLISRIGDYPHAGLTGEIADKSGPKKQGTRMIKVTCPNQNCGYTCRTTKKWLEIGVPTCPCGEQMEPDAEAMEEAGDEEETA